MFLEAVYATAVLYMSTAQAISEKNKHDRINIKIQFQICLEENVTLLCTLVPYINIYCAF